MFEEIKIEKIEGYCQLCEDYANRNATTPSKVAIMSCEGACSRGEVSRRAANLITHKLSKENTVRICLGGAFTKDGGQRNLVRDASKAIAIEGCFIDCSSRMMKGVIPDLKPIVIQADSIYKRNLPFGIDEVSDEEFNNCANIVAEDVIKNYINGDCEQPSTACCSEEETFSCCNNINN